MPISSVEISAFPAALPERLRSVFISVEVALSLVLLVGASLLANSLWHLIHSPLGFQPESGVDI